MNNNMLRHHWSC